MFVDTDTLKATREWLRVEVEVASNRVMSAIQTHRSHPTFISKTQIRDHVIEMRFIYSLWNRAGGYEVRDDTLAYRVGVATDSAREYGIKF